MLPGENQLKFCRQFFKTATNSEDVNPNYPTSVAGQASPIHGLAFSFFVDIFYPIAGGKIVDKFALLKLFKNYNIIPCRVVEIRPFATRTDENYVFTRPD